MAPIHRASRVGNDDMVARLLARREDANAFTYRGRAPGNLGVLACLGEAGQRRLYGAAVLRTTAALAERMIVHKFDGQNQNGNTIWHVMTMACAASETAQYSFDRFWREGTLRTATASMASPNAIASASGKPSFTR